MHLLNDRVNDLSTVTFLAARFQNSHLQFKSKFENSQWGSQIQRNQKIIRDNALCAESEVRKAVERSSYAVALKFRVFFLFLKSVKF